MGNLRISDLHRQQHREALRRARLARIDARAHARLLREAATARLYFRLLRELGE